MLIYTCKMGVSADGLRKATHLTGCHQSEAGKHDLKGGVLPELARVCYTSDEQRTALHHFFYSQPCSEHAFIDVVQ